MRLIAILIAIFGGLLIFFAMTEPMMPSDSQNWTMIGSGFIFGGLFLYAYMGKRKK